MSFTVTDPEFETLVDTSTPIEQIATGFEFLEGPVWHPVGKYLVFSDIPQSIRWRWDPEGGATELLNPTNKGNGLTFDAALNLLACEHATSSVVRFDARTGEREVLCSHFEGKGLNSPNDIVVRSDGAIYFTDPPFGRTESRIGVPRELELDFQGVYFMSAGHAAGAEPALAVEPGLFARPNGLCFSPDESLLYINDTQPGIIHVFSVAPDGSLSSGRVFAEGILEEERPGKPDGMKCDALGNVWVTGPGGIWIYAPDGRKLGEVSFPENAANFHFGGEDWCTLFVTARKSVYTCRTKVGPHREPFMGA